MKRKEYRRPQMTVMELQQRGLLMTSGNVGATNSIEDWEDGETTNESIYF